MKYAILIGDGMSDTPLKELGGKTPLEAARTPNMDYLAQNGECGWVNNVPAGMPPGSDVAAMSIFGYDPQKLYTGRGPLEAASLGVKLNKGDVAFRCNLVTINDGLMDSFTAGHISTEEAAHTRIVHAGAEVVEAGQVVELLTGVQEVGLRGAGVAVQLAEGSVGVAVNDGAGVVGLHFVTEIAGCFGTISGRD